MRRILALFDAPEPARRALAALAVAGVAADDVWVTPMVPGTGAWAAGPLAPSLDLAALRQSLAARDVPPPLVEVYVEGVRRGAILVLVESPTASAPVVAGCLTSASAPDLAALVARWKAQPGTTYDWASAVPPQVDPPTA
jgi:hypothetical protein